MARLTAPRAERLLRRFGGAGALVGLLGVGLVALLLARVPEGALLWCAAPVPLVHLVGIPVSWRVERRTLDGAGLLGRQAWAGVVGGGVVGLLLGLPGALAGLPLFTGAVGAGVGGLVAVIATLLGLGLPTRAAGVLAVVGPGVFLVAVALLVTVAVDPA